MSKYIAFIDELVRIMLAISYNLCALSGSSNLISLGLLKKFQTNK